MRLKFRADQVKGKLLLTHGTSDVNVPFSNTVEMIAVLIRAGKPYDLLVLPGQDHGVTVESMVYEPEAIRRYFQEHRRALPAGFLVVGFRARWNAEVENQANVALVDA